ncbi:MAG: MFS transporter [Opitutaceae bacterium]|nr:MFS transporter [Opitutaceae bacterium]
MPRGLWVLVGGQFINKFGSFVMPFLTLFLAGRGLGPGQIASILAAISIGHLVAPFVSGYLTDAIGRRDTIVLSLAGGAVAILGIYFAGSYTQIIVIAAVYGFLSSMFSPPANALISDLVPPELRVTAFALLRLAINAGFAAGPAVAGVLFTRAPMLIFIGDAATTLVFAALAWAFLPHGLRTVTGRVTSVRVVARSWVEATTDMVRNGPYVQLLIATLCMAVAFQQVFCVLALDATERGLDPVHYGLLMGSNGVFIALFELPLSQWTKRMDPRRVLRVGYAMVALGCASFALAQTFSQFLAAMALFTFGEMLSLPVAAGYGSQLAPAQFRGRYFGWSTVVWSLAGMAGSSGVWFYGTVGAVWWLWSGLVAGVGTLVMWPRLRARPVIDETAAAPAK